MILRPILRRKTCTSRGALRSWARSLTSRPSLNPHTAPASTSSSTPPDEARPETGASGAVSEPDLASEIQRYKAERRKRASQAPGETSKTNDSMARLRADEKIKSEAPTLGELEAIHRSFTPEDPDYYIKLKDKIGRSFNASQVLYFLKELCPTATNLPTTKSGAIEYLMADYWKIAVPEDQLSYVESIGIYPDQMFLLLGKDGSAIAEVSRYWGLQIQPQYAPLSLLVTGSLVRVRKFKAHLRQLRNASHVDRIPSPVPKVITSDQLPMLSRLSGAYFSLPDGQVEVVTRDKASLSTARRLVNRAAFELLFSKSTPILLEGSIKRDLSSRSMKEPQYAAFPHLSPEPLPWTAPSAKAFRVRRVGGAGLGVGDPSVPSDGPSSTFGLGLRSRLLEALPPLGPESKRLITARSGHVIFTPTNANDLSSSFASFGQSRTSSAALRDLMSSDDYRCSFLPDMSPILKKSSDRSKRTDLRFYRFIYRQKPMRPTTERRPLYPKAQKTLVVDFALRSNGKGYDWTTYFGDEYTIMVACPDRTMDVMISVFDWRHLRLEEVPWKIRAFNHGNKSDDPLESRRAPPDDMEGLNLGGDPFYIDTIRSIAQTSLGGQGDPKTQLYKDRILDLDSKHNSKSLRIQLSLDETGNPSDEQWANFLQICDSTSSSPYFKP